MSHIYVSRWGAGVDLKRCRTAVHNEGSFGFHQCSRKGVVEENGMLFCYGHSSEGEAKRLAKSREKERDQLAKWKAEVRREKLKSAAVDAIRQIASGHNDPRSLAIDVLRIEEAEG